MSHLVLIVTSPLYCGCGGVAGADFLQRWAHLDYSTVLRGHHSAICMPEDSHSDTIFSDEMG